MLNGKMIKIDPLPSNEPQMFNDVSERINPFPTHMLEHVPCKSAHYIPIFRAKSNTQSIRKGEINR